jgi:hypothetical protein
MFSVKNGGLLFLLAVPFALYIGWQVREVARIDRANLAPPSTTGLPNRDQLNAIRARADTWAGEVRKVAAVALQFRTLTADDLVTDSECSALAKAAADRGANLNDLETFLAGVVRPEFTGALRQRYQDWHVSQVKLNRAEQAIESWFTMPLTGLDNPESVAEAWTAVNSLIAEYAKEPRFSIATKPAVWRLRARIRMVELLAESAHDPFEKVVTMKLPLPPETVNAAVKRALSLSRLLREQAQPLQDEFTELERAGLGMPVRVADDARRALRRAEEWATRHQLLALLVEPELFTRSDTAADWLAKMQLLYDQSLAEDRDRIRAKVQEFCDAYIPRVVALDDFVLLDGQKVPRNMVTIKYFPRGDGGSERTRLSADVSGLTEFNLAEKHPGENTLVIVGATEYTPKQLQPTELSKAAVAYSQARAEVGTGTGLPGWSAQSIEEFQNKCKPRAAEINQLKVPESPRGEPRIWDRLQSLSRGVTLSRSLFEKPSQLAR